MKIKQVHKDLLAFLADKKSDDFYLIELEVEGRRLHVNYHFLRSEYINFLEINKHPNLYVWDTKEPTIVDYHFARYFIFWIQCSN